MLNLTPRQAQALATVYENRETFLLGGVRSGKSLVTAEAAAQAVWEWEPETDGALCAPTFGQLERNLLAPWEAAMRQLGGPACYEVIANPKNPRVHCYRGAGEHSTVYLASGKNPGNIEGVTLGWVAGTELQQMSEFWGVVRRRVSDARARRLRLWGDGLTEEGWLSGEVEKRGIATVYFDTQENAHNLGAGYLDGLADVLTPRQWRIYVRGKWAGAEDAVYPTFARDVHAAPDRRVEYRPDRGRVFLAQDWNLNPMTTIAGQWADSTLWVFDELIRPATTTEHAEAIKHWMSTKYSLDATAGNGVVVIADSTGARRNQGDGRSNFAIFMSAGLTFAGLAHNPPIGDSTQSLLVLFRNARREVRIYIDRYRCPKTVEALAQLRHDDGDDSPFSHPCAALRYLAWHLVPLTAPGAAPKSAGARQERQRPRRRGRVSI